jgi:hypothetical protein
MATYTRQIDRLLASLTAYETARDEILAGRTSSTSINGRALTLLDLPFLEGQIEKLERRIRELRGGITKVCRFDIYTP